MNVGFLKRFRRNAELAGARLDQRQRSLRTFLHHFAELPGQYQLSGPRHARRFDKQNVATDRRPGEPGGNTGNAAAHGDFRLELTRPEDGRKVIGSDLDLLHAAFGDAHRDVAKCLADFALEVAHPGFPRVIANDHRQRLVADLALLGLETRRRKLTRDEVATRDLQFFLRRVAGQLDHFHAVAQRPGNGVENVGRTDEHHARQIEGHGEVVIAEGRVLLGVEHLEQRR